MFKGKMLVLPVFISLVAIGLLASCDIKEAIEDALKQPFHANVDLTLEKLLPQKSAGDDIDVIEDCNTTSASGELNKVGELKGIDLDIDDVILRKVQIRYKNASWAPERIDSVPCEVTLSGQAGSAVISEFEIDGPSFNWDDADLSPEADALITHFLNDRGDSFTYCASCSDGEDTFTAEVDLKIKVEVKGTVTLDL